MFSYRQFSPDAISPAPTATALGDIDELRTGRLHGVVFEFGYEEECLLSDGGRPGVNLCRGQDETS